MDLAGKCILVTGGANGIGKELQAALRRAGAVAGVMDSDARALDSLVPGEDLDLLACDVTRTEEVARAVETFFEKRGRIDALINNAGIIRNAPLVNLMAPVPSRERFEEFDQVIRTNLCASVYVTTHAVTKMLKKRTRGVVVNVSSVCASGNAGQGAYSAAKAGLEALTVTWAKELAPLGIRVAAVAPGFTATDTTIGSMAPNVLNDWKKRTPLRRLAEPGEIADGVLFILKNDFFNARVLNLDGGLRI